MFKPIEGTTSSSSQASLYIYNLPVRLTLALELLENVTSAKKLPRGVFQIWIERNTFKWFFFGGGALIPSFPKKRCETRLWRGFIFSTWKLCFVLSVKSPKMPSLNRTETSHVRESLWQEEKVDHRLSTRGSKLKGILRVKYPLGSMVQIPQPSLRNKPNYFSFHK